MSDFFTIQTQTPWGRNLQLFTDWIAPQPGRRALDIGCGPGLLPALLAEKGCRALGVDLDPAAFQPARLHPQLIAADACALPFASAAFDLITASNVLFLLPDPPAALREMARLLCPGGQICLLNPSENLSVAAALAIAGQRGLQGAARESLIGWARRAEAHRRWGEADYRQLFAGAGLQLIETSLKIGPGFAHFTRGTLRPQL